MFCEAPPSAGLRPLADDSLRDDQSSSTLPLVHGPPPYHDASDIPALGRSPPATQLMPAASWHRESGLDQLTEREGECRDASGEHDESECREASRDQPEPSRSELPSQTD